MEEQKIKKIITFSKILIVGNSLILLNILIKWATIILQEGGGVVFAKRNIIGVTVIMLVSFIFSGKLRKIGNKKMANALSIFGFIFLAIICFYTYIIIITYLYPNSY